MTLPELISSCRYIDAHSHSDEYSDRSAMLREVEENRILTLNSAVDPASMKASVELNKSSPWLLDAAGIHPWKAGEFSPETVESLEEEYSRVLQISEIGMDTVWAPPSADIRKQEAVLEAQLFLARKYKKPVTLHTKGAEKQVLALLRQFRPPAVLIHWFDGSNAELKGFLDMGCHFTVSPALITDSRFQRIIRKVPLDRILPETDNPGTWPWLFQIPGRPLQIQNVMEEASSFFNSPSDELLDQFKNNLLAFLFCGEEKAE